MMRYMILGIGAMSALAAVVGYRLGSVQMTQTQAIETVSELWVANGGLRNECSAVPGQAEWLLVRCGSGENMRLWRVTENGRIAAMKEGA